MRMLILTLMFLVLACKKEDPKPKPPPPPPPPKTQSYVNYSIWTKDIGHLNYAYRVWWGADSLGLFINTHDSVVFHGNIPSQTIHLEAIKNWTAHDTSHIYFFLHKETGPPITIRGIAIDTILTLW